MTDPINFGEKQHDYGVGYPTPFSIPDETTCRTFQVPASDENAEWLALVMGLMMTLTFPENWVQFEDAIDRDEAAARWQEMIEQAYVEAQEGVCGAPVPAPYWDSESDADDEASGETQEWYGEVVEDDFRGDISQWLITGFLASTGNVGAAIQFHTLASQFRLAWKRGNVGGIVRVFVDSADVGTVDTFADTPDIYEQTYVGDPDLEEHDILMMLEELHV